jgi:hypothetical protein
MLPDPKQAMTKPSASQRTRPAATVPAKGSPPLAKPPVSPPGDTRPGCLRGFLRSPIVIVSLAVLLGLMLVTVASAATGWSLGVGEFNSTATIESGLYMLDQYNRALDELAADEFSLARQRLEYIFSQNPEFLDVREQLIYVLTITGITPEPTQFVLTATPTEDPRPKEDLLASAQSLINTQDWTAAIDTLLALRKADPNYRTAEVDGWLYAALRNRGVVNIIQLGLFEPGLYDFSLAEDFGPLDAEATNYREWARLYLLGNAFWLAYPQDAAYYYGLLTGLAPNLADSSGLTAFYRYWQSLIHYGDQLAAAGEWCGAYEQYQLAQAARQDGALVPTADFAFSECMGPSDTPTVAPSFTSTPLFTFTPSVTVPGPTATPSVTSSPGPTATSSNTTSPTTQPTPSDTPTSSNTLEPSNTPSDTPTATETATETPSETPTP